MTYRFELSESLVLKIIDSNNEVVEESGPWVDEERATMWATMYCDDLNSGRKSDPRLPVEEPTE